MSDEQFNLDFFTEKIGSLYRSSGNYGAAFIANHTLAELEKVPQQGIIDDLIALCKKPDKSVIEKELTAAGKGKTIENQLWLLKGRLRSGDLIGRYGGEEFLIGLSDVSPEQARAVIDRIRGDFSALPHAHPGGALYATFSAGIASYPLLDNAIHAWIGLVDQFLHIQPQDLHDGQGLPLRQVDKVRHIDHGRLLGIEDQIDLSSWLHLGPGHGILYDNPSFDRLVIEDGIDDHGDHVPIGQGLLRIFQPSSRKVRNDVDIPMTRVTAKP